jgi:hypothetical protein
MASKRIALTQTHIEEVLGQNIQIGSDSTATGLRKQFVFNPWANEYRVLCGSEVVDAGQAMEELLVVYNEL